MADCFNPDLYTSIKDQGGVKQAKLFEVQQNAAKFANLLRMFRVQFKIAMLVVNMHTYFAFVQRSRLSAFMGELSR